MSLKIVEVKRKILLLVRNRESAKAIRLFFKYFTEDKPAEIEFLKNFYVELNRNDYQKDGYEFFKQIKDWYLGNEEFDEILDNATQTYVSKLILLANSVRFQRLDKQKRLEESLRRADTLTRQKMQVENTKQLDALNDKSIELYKLALKLSPNNLIALKGWYDCCILAKNHEDAKKIQQKISAIKEEEIQAKLNEKHLHEKEEAEEKVYINYYNIYKEMLEQHKYNEVIQNIEELEKIYIFPPEVYLLKAKALAELKKFKESDKTIYKAERLFPDFNILKQTIDEINQIKFGLYAKAGSLYLNKGLKLGIPLGRSNFLKAKVCFLKAIKISISNLDVLDQAYTTFKYLGDEKNALETKAAIVTVDPNYRITYDSKFKQNLCFIATYAFYDEPEIVDEFRWFRREYMLTNSFGRLLNSLYVSISQKVTKALIGNNFFKIIFKIILHFPLFIIRILKKWY